MRRRAEAGVFREIAVIVAGVLIALGADAFWGWAQDRRKEQNYLGELEIELSAARQELTGDIEWRTRGMENITKLLAYVAAAREAPRDSVRLWLGDLSLVPFYAPPSEVMDDLTASGALKLIRSDSLRLALLKYQQDADRIRQYEQREWELWVGFLLPHLAPRTALLNQRRPGEETVFPFGLSGFRDGFDTLRRDRTLEGLLFERYRRGRITNSTAADILLELDSALELIHATAR